MTVAVKPHARRNEILRLLVRHSALSVKTIQCLLREPISRRRLRDVLARAIRDGVFVRRRFGALAVPVGFYEVAEPHRSNHGIPTIHSSHLMHNDLCSIAHEVLARNFPDAEIHREHEIPRVLALRSILKYDHGTRDSLPDLLLVQRAQDQRRLVTVAVEVERSDKGATRLYRKLSKYAMRTLLDGVIYLSESEQLLDSLRATFRNRVGEGALRIGHYREHFFVSAPCPTRRTLALTELQNTSGGTLSIARWMGLLLCVPPLQRRDLEFKRPSPCGVAESTPHEEQEAKSFREDARAHPPNPSPSSLPNPSPPTSV